MRAFEGYRVPLTEDQVVSYKLNRLTVHQEQMLEHWGYPYVMEEFRFHISVTDRIENLAERKEVMKALEIFATPVLGKPIMVGDIVVFGQASPEEPMLAIERIPFGRSK